MTMSIPVARPENHCRRKGCECLHDGCVHGWIDFTDHDGKEWTKPCPTCRFISRHSGRSAGSVVATV